MAATTTSSIKKLVDRIKRDTPYTLTRGNDFQWSADKQTITHPSIDTPQKVWSLLHEVAHATLGHHTFTLDVQLVEMEAAAWNYARGVLAPRYDVAIDPDYIEDHLDTYRNWLHERSLCPACGQNGLQTHTKTYSCINCRSLWRANEARLCNLRRTKLVRQV